MLVRFYFSLFEQDKNSRINSEFVNICQRSGIFAQNGSAKNSYCKCRCFYYNVCFERKGDYKKKKRKNRFWTSYFLKTRNSVQLIRDITTDDRSGLFRNFSRMPQEDFQYLISLIGPKIDIDMGCV